ncbi:hypothetical protein BHAOGJBA_6014 [Methylobacterium hispanicum]|uniref:Uncharacterized protein n=1 Tax=Methylobacterium hispanicum TaxID=270350 RepID=A0AAV4ZZK4_9HYPH|nr:hypothetical protein [Methylobacterium hispanicum]GJD92460.1 hypothetical protein BHAOGJBA_6014 [Methylobacterium hispanicum]
MPNEAEHSFRTGWAYAGQYGEGEWKEIHFKSTRSSKTCVGDKIVATGRVNVRKGPASFDGEQWVNAPKIGLANEGDTFILRRIIEVSNGHHWFQISVPSREVEPVGGYVYMGRYQGEAWGEIYFESVDPEEPVKVGGIIVATGNVFIRSGYIEYDGEKWANKPIVGVAEEGENFVVREVRQVSEGFYWLKIAPAERDVSDPKNTGTLWIEVKDSQVNRRDVPINAADILLNDFLRNSAPVHVRPKPSADTPPKFTMPADHVFEVVGTKPSDKPGSRWVNIQTAFDSEAQAPDLSGIDIKFENGIWWEHPVAEATGGYDAKNKKTLINSFNIVVFGPSSVRETIVDVLRNCVKISAVAAYEAFQAAPSPEIGARIGAAFAAFKATLMPCVSTTALGRELASEFSLGYIRRGRWVDGLNLRCVVQSPTAENYRALHNMVKDKLPDPVNKLIMFYIATHEIPPIDIKLDCPPIINDAIAALPHTEKLREFADAAERLAAERGKNIIPEIKAEAEKLVRKRGQELIDMIPALPMLVSGPIAAEIVKHAPSFIQETVIPAVRNGVPVLGPAQIIAEQLGIDLPSPEKVITDILGVFRSPIRIPDWIELP